MSDDKRYIRVGDLWPPLAYEVYYEDLNLDVTSSITGATPVAFTMRNATTRAVVINARAGAVTVGNKLVTASMDWQSGDTATAGIYEVKVVFTVSGKPATAPSHGWKTVVIEA